MNAAITLAMASNLRLVSQCARERKIGVSLSMAGLLRMPGRC
jgi:hypothetical protein